MASDVGEKDYFIEEDSALRGLAFELKNPLINIARQAELGDSDLSIQQTAEQALMLIDGYLLNAQTEYGQIMLDLEPASIGSVLYDASVQLSGLAKKNNVEIMLEDKTVETVMTHRKALISILSVFGSALIGNSDNKRVHMRGYKNRDGKLEVGIFGKAKISQSDIDKSLELQGKAHMPFSKINSNSHVSLAVSDGLCRAIGGKMKVKRIGGLSGLTTELPISEQLAFV